MDEAQLLKFIAFTQSTLGEPFPVLLGFVVGLWVVHLLQVIVGRGQWVQWGIQPRQGRGLWGILWAPCLHVNWSHLQHNTVPLLLLGSLVMVQVGNYFYGVTVLAWAIGGLGVWIFGEEGVHLGASSLIWGYCGFLLPYGLVVARTPLGIAVTLGVLVCYGSILVMGLMFRQEGGGISWQGHQFGFAGGWLAARFMADIQGWLALWSWG